MAYAPGCEPRFGASRIFISDGCTDCRVLLPRELSVSGGWQAVVTSSLIRLEPHTEGP